METTLPTHAAFDAYEAIAPFYDAYTAGYDHERWLGNLHAIAVEHGLSGRRLLDVGCGTGKSFRPMLRRGFDVVACDISQKMVDAAAASVVPPLDASVLVADMRELPVLGEFDLATCLDDALNYVLSEREFEAALAGVARNLRPGGMFVFDLNTLGTYRRLFTRDFVKEVDDALFCWRGDGDSEPVRGGTTSARVEIFAHRDGVWERTTTRHVQRHHPPSFVRQALDRSGFDLLLVHGQIDAAQIEAEADDDYHVKLVYLARRRGS